MHKYICDCKYLFSSLKRKLCKKFQKQEQCVRVCMLLIHISHGKTPHSHTIHTGARAHHHHTYAHQTLYTQFKFLFVFYFFEYFFPLPYIQRLTKIFVELKNIQSPLNTLYSNIVTCNICIERQLVNYFFEDDPYASHFFFCSGNSFICSNTSRSFSTDRNGWYSIK